MRGKNHNARYPLRPAIALLGALLCVVMPGVATAAVVEGLRMWASSESTRLVFDISEPVDHKVFMLQGPDRLVIDLLNTRQGMPTPNLDLGNSQISGLRSAARNAVDLRMVLDLKGKVRPKSFLLKPTEQYGHRLVIDLEGEVSAPAKTVARSSLSTASEGRNVIIAIDAGHGGDDPGALGRGGTREKDVVLQISKRLQELINQQHGMQAVMIRSGDYYLSLRKRMQMARELNADLFVSIHADAFRDNRARGGSVYVLSQKGASSEAARWLAESENKSDLIGGVSLEDKDDLLASVLLDLSQNATIAASLDVGNNVLREMGRVGKLHRNHVEQAGFVVLKAPDIPSILVETGYISNPQEEKNLRDVNYQEKLAQAMLRGIHGYFQHNPPPGTLLASTDRKHVIRHGDTLSSIAQYYRVSLASLRNVNNLGNDDSLLVGQSLRIPTM